MVREIFIIGLSFPRLIIVKSPEGASLMMILLTSKVASIISRIMNLVALMTLKYEGNDYGNTIRNSKSNREVTPVT